MMAKMFYTLEETKTALGKNEEEIKQFAREGRLREFRDGPRLMFKADQVEAIKNELGLGGGDSGGSDIGITDTGAPIGLVDSRGAALRAFRFPIPIRARSGSVSGIAMAGSGTGSGTGMPLKDDTALAADVGLSGSMGGVPSPGRPGSSGLTGTAAGRSGISIFSEEGETADPSAQTNIASTVPDQISLEAVGSGSGLLDLTRESDDTSLGAELLDEIAPGTGSKAGSRGPVGSAAASSAAGTRVGGTAVAEPAINEGGGGRIRGGMPMTVEQADPFAPAFAGAAFGASIFVIFGGLVVTSAILGTKLPLVTALQEHNLSLWALFGIGAGVSLLCFVVGVVAGKR